MLDTIRDLRDAGFTDRQAEAVVDAIRDGQKDFATKADLARIEESLRHAIMMQGTGLERTIATLSGDLRTAIADRAIDTLKWVVGTIVASVTINVGAIIALVKLLGH